LSEKKSEKTCYIMAGGDLLESPRLYKMFLEGKAPIFAADSGVDNLLKLGILPQKVFGDMDSISKEGREKIRQNRIEIKKYPAQKDKTDLHLVAEEAIKMGYDFQIILGGWGGRPDHSLGAVAVLDFLLKEGKKGILLNPFSSIEMINKKVTLYKNEGGTFSLLPWGGSVGGLHIRGCEYNLKDGELFSSETRGLSNEIREEKADIIVEKGKILVLRNLAKPFGLCFFPKT